MRLAKENLGKVSVTVEKDVHNIIKEYDKLTVVEEEGQFRTFISRKPVPIGIELTDREYWLPFSGVKESIVIDYNKFKQYIRTGEGLLDDSIVTRHIKDKNVTGDKIAEATITFVNIADEAVTLPKINKTAIDTTLTKEGYLAEAKHTGERLLNIEGLSVVKVPSVQSTVLDAWQIIDKKGNVHGVTINTYKDKSIDAIWLSVNEDDPQPENPEIKVDNPRYLNIIYNKADGTQQKVSIPLSSFVTEAEFSKNGFKVIDGAVNLKISSDITTSRYFHFDADGNITLDGFEERILEDLGTLEHSESGDGTMWGEFKRAEEIREQTSDSAHTVFSDNWDEQDDDPEDYDPLSVTEASYAYNWKTTDTPASDGKTEGNLKDFYNKILDTEEKVTELEETSTNHESRISTMENENEKQSGKLSKLEEKVGKIIGGNIHYEASDKLITIIEETNVSKYHQKKIVMTYDSPLEFEVILYDTANTLHYINYQSGKRYVETELNYEISLIFVNINAQPQDGNVFIKFYFGDIIPSIKILEDAQNKTNEKLNSEIIRSTNEDGNIKSNIKSLDAKVDNVAVGDYCLLKDTAISWDGTNIGKIIQYAGRDTIVVKVDKNAKNVNIQGVTFRKNLIYCYSDNPLKYDNSKDVYEGVLCNTEDTGSDYLGDTRTVAQHNYIAFMCIPPQEYKNLYIGFESNVTIHPTDLDSLLSNQLVEYDKKLNLPTPMHLDIYKTNKYWSLQENVDYIVNEYTFNNYVAYKPIEVKEGERYIITSYTEYTSNIRAYILTDNVRKAYKYADTKSVVNKEILIEKDGFLFITAQNDFANITSLSKINYEEKEPKIGYISCEITRNISGKYVRDGRVQSHDDYCIDAIEVTEDAKYRVQGALRNWSFDYISYLTDISATTATDVIAHDGSPMYIDEVITIPAGVKYIALTRSKAKTPYMFVSKVVEVEPYTIVAVGDSITQGYGSDDYYTSQDLKGKYRLSPTSMMHNSIIANYARLLKGKAVLPINLGYSSETIANIMARIGATPYYCKKAITLKADKSEVTIGTYEYSSIVSSYDDTSLANGYSLDLFGKELGGFNPFRVYVGNKYVEFNLFPKGQDNSSSFVAQVINDIDEDVTITASTPIYCDACKYQHPDLLLICIGTNGFKRHTNEDIVTAHQQAIEFLQPKNYIVFSLFSKTVTEEVEKEKELEKLMLKKFGSHYFNTRKYLVENGLSDAGITPIASDIAKIEQGVPPTSLLYVDEVHLNEKGYLVVAKQLYNLAKINGL